jgi:predicted patatin/cPLA2 family phospholipase
LFLGNEAIKRSSNVKKLTIMEKHKDWKPFGEKTALVLEGGGMRGVFTCGVLDYLMDHGITFPYAVGVSAGAGNGLSYLSGQRGRAKFSNIDLLEKYHYIGVKNIWNHHSIIDQDLLYRMFPEVILPYDHEAAMANPMRFEMVTTDCHTGRPCYFESHTDSQRMLDICKASGSLPYVCPIAYVDGRPMLDGGIVDSIPVERALGQGYEHAVVVMTRNYGYRTSGRDVRVPRFIYKRYPRLRVALSNRLKLYDEQLALVERLEAEGRITVVRPMKPLEVDRITTDPRKLTALYEEGYACAGQVLGKKIV